MANSKIAVVTGATRGFGRAVALQLAAQGWHIVALGRTVGALEELDDAIVNAGGSTTLVPIDFMGDLDLCDALGAQLQSKFDKLDALVLAAGTLGMLTPLSHMDPVLMHRTMQVNAMAPYRLIRALDPLLRTGNGKVAAITCSLGDDTKAYWAHYRASKAALSAMIDSYAAEVKTMGVTAFAFDPGAMETGLYREAFPGAAPGSLPLPADAAARLIAQL